MATAWFAPCPHCGSALSYLQGVTGSTMYPKCPTCRHDVEVGRATFLMADHSRPGLRRPATKIAAAAKLPVLVLAMLVVFLSACSARQTVALREDGVITKDVQARLAADPVARDATIGVETKAGIVSLSGAVTTDTVRDSAERIARDTPGVTAVDNDLRFGGPIGAR